MTRPLSIRFDQLLLERLRRRASVQATTPSGLAQRLVDEGLRVQEHPGVLFRDGPTGRRPALIGGPDVWEVVSALRYSSARGEDAILATAEEMNITATQIKIALDYYGAYSDEIDSQISENERAVDEAYAAWERQRRLLA